VIAGPFARATFAGIDLVALSPGVPKATPQIVAVNVPVVSEIELFAAGVREQVPGSKIIAITGSNGKTTTTALTAHLLNGAGVSAIACGNISPSALDALMDAQDAGQLCRKSGWSSCPASSSKRRITECRSGDGPQYLGRPS
jgi:UDP-N-acetylmuramoylalanine--D-glutamate ligase